MLSDALKNGLDVLKKNKVIFVPFIILGIISILSFLFVAKPMFEFELTTYQSSYSSTFYANSDGFDSYFFKKFMDIMNLIIIYSIFLFVFTVLANVAGLRAVKDYLNGQKTKILDIGKTTITKGPVAIFGVLAANILFFLPGIIGIILFIWSFSLLPSSVSASYSGMVTLGEIMLVVFIMFFIQVIILLAVGYYILSKKFRKIYLWGTIITFILLILTIAIGFINPLLLYIFLIPFLILFMFLTVVLIFITFIVISSITYILPSVIVLNDNTDVTDAVKKSLNFVKDNTKKFTFLILIVFVIQLLVSIPALIISFANAMEPSFSLYVIEEIFSIVLDIIVAPYILSVYALTYVYSLMKEKESKNKKDENEKDTVVLPEEIKSTQNLSQGLRGLSKTW